MFFFRNFCEIILISHLPKKITPSFAKADGDRLNAGRHSKRFRGRVARQSSAKASTAVRIRPEPLKRTRWKISILSAFFFPESRVRIS